MNQAMRHIEEVLPPDDLTAQVAYRIRLVQIAAYKNFERSVTGFGIAPRYYGMLKFVAANPGICQARLAEAIYLDRSSLVPILSTLTREGWIERKSDHGDRRVRQVFLTAEGAARLRQLDAMAAAHEALLTDGFDDAERATFLRLLQRAGDNLRRSEALADGDAASQ
ncbi:MarR family winged helix-turn-helix transcriptional regulator [Aquicoccus sp. G2-2]|uniref:MarR family winged helix-turn-helix transcriptional regulator n=1 Tax=Aquicoccus sp. G2-2 TaxID=3092120 RepID=UPI002ADF6C8C|nr:MarR family transcriptional regulator [Aquicoccus sp. G2-2]MEA1112824.1 MarR family transcriptional regulator [Aquicoccus sp. G2-2]